MKIFTLFRFFAFFFSTLFILKAQEVKNKDYVIPEFDINLKYQYLPTPTVFMSEDASDYEFEYKQSGVFLGQKPENFNGKILLVVPGFAMTYSAKFLQDYQTYKWFYELGYAVAFINPSRGLGDFYNGKCIALAIDNVIEHFNKDLKANEQPIDKLSLIGYSNGGVASEIAHTYYDKADKIESVYTFGTPYFGTPVADLTNFFPTFMTNSVILLYHLASSYLVHFGDLQSSFDYDSAVLYLSSIAYRTNILRPLLDNDPDNKPEDFVVAASYNFFDFKVDDIPNQYIFGYLFGCSFMALTGSLISILSPVNFSDGQNITDLLGPDLNPFPYSLPIPFLDIKSTQLLNDGLTKYDKYLRPNATAYKEFVTLNRNHAALAIANKYLVNLTHQLIVKHTSQKNTNSKSNISRRKISNSTSDNQRNLVYESNFQSNLLGEFKLDKNSKDKAYIFTPTIDSTSIKEDYSNLDNKNSSNLRITKSNFSDYISKSVKVYNGTKSNQLKSTQSMKVDGQNSESLLFQKGITTKLEIDYNNDIFENQSNPYPKLIINTKENGSIINVRDLKIKAIVKREMTINGIKKDEKSIELDFLYNPNINGYQANTDNLEWGLYSFVISVENNQFRRDLTGSFTVGTLFPKVNLVDDEENKSNKKTTIALNNNNSKMLINLGDFYTSDSENIKVKLYNSNGLFIEEINKKIVNKINVEIDLSMHGIFLQKGIYFISLSNKSKSKNFKLMVK